MHAHTHAQREGVRRRGYSETATAHVCTRRCGSRTTHIHNTMVVHNLKAGQRNDFACRLVSFDQMKSLLMLWGSYIQITVQS